MKIDNRYKISDFFRSIRLDLYSNKCILCAVDILGLKGLLLDCLSLENLSDRGDSPFGPEKVNDFIAVVCFLIMHPQRLVGIKETLISN